jgi:hypothetical protein
MSISAKCGNGNTKSTSHTPTYTTVLVALKLLFWIEKRDKVLIKSALLTNRLLCEKDCPEGNGGSPPYRVNKTQDVGPETPKKATGQKNQANE